MLHLLRASAGAGKTHQLVHTYLQYILAHPRAVSRVVVLSFTNKATQELKTRILSELHALARGKECRSHDTLKQALGYDDLTLQGHAQQALDHILYHYDTFAVYTIDSFFQNLLRAFSYELGISSHYALLLEQRQLIDTCVQQLFQALPHDARLQEALTSLAIEKIAEGKAWQVTKEMTRWGEDILTSLDVHTSSASLTASPGWEETLTLLIRLSEEAETFRKGLQTRATTILTHLQRAGLTAQDFAWADKGVIGFLKKLSQGAKIPAPSSRIREAAHDPKAWVSKRSPRRNETLALAEERLLPLLSDLLTYLDAHHATYQTTKTLWSLRHRLITTQTLHHLFTAYLQKHDTLLIHKVPTLIQAIVSESSLPFFEGKTGQHFDHFLIDEGQDLSTPQWQGMAPLIQQSITHGHDSWIVGDAKQAIYRWRGGNPQLLLTQVEEAVGTAHIQVRDLSYNWRSKPVIVHFNNTFFTQAAEVLTQALQKEVSSQQGVDTQALQAAVSHIQKAYAHSAQKLPSTVDKDQGYMQVTFLPTERRGDAWKSQAIEGGIAIIERLQQEGYQAQDICWLVRNHREAQQLLSALLAHSKGDQAKPKVCYEAITTASFTLADNHYIQLLISALKCLSQPHDRVSLATLVHLYQTLLKAQNTVHTSSDSLKDQQPRQRATQAHDLSATDHAYFLTFDDPVQTAAYLPKGFFTRQTILKRLGLYTLVDQLIHTFQLSKVAEPAYLNAFREVIHTFAQRREHSLIDFIDWWDKYGIHEAKLAPTTQGAMQIMTIHQAKGLAFKAVIIPFCAWDLDHNVHHPPIITGATTQEPFDTLGTIPLAYKTQLKETYYATTYLQEQWQQYLEQLNLLYVSFTRARDACYVLTPQVQNSRLKTTADLLNHCLMSQHLTASTLTQQGSWDQEQLTWYAGTLPQQTIASPTPKLSLSSAPRSTEEPIQGQYAEITQHIVSTHAQGLWWHDLFSRITTRESFGPLLEHYVQTQQLSQAEAHRVNDLLSRLFQDERLQEWFSGRWEVYRERTLTLPSGALYRPDRVMTAHPKAVVLDFKIGNPLPSHHKQVRTYIDLIEELGYTSVEGYLLYLPTAQLVAVKSG